MERDVLLVPIANPASAERLVATAIDLSNAFDLAIDVLHVVRVPPQIPMSAAPEIIESDTDFVFDAVEKIKENGLSGTARVRYARSVSKGIITATEDPSVRITLLGWRGRPQRRDIVLGSYLDNVVNRAESDILIERVDEGERSIGSICLPTAGGVHIGFASRVADAIARENDASIQVMHVVAPGTEETGMAESYLEEMLDEIGAGVDVDLKLIEHESVTDGILEQSAQHDLTIMGAAEEGMLSQALFGAIPERVGRDATSGVILAKRRLPLRERVPLLRRFL